MVDAKPKESDAGVYHHGDLPNALLNALGELVEETGSSDVSLREVARRAGVSHSAPAHHFGDKEGMLVAFCNEGNIVLARALQAARNDAAGGSAPDRLAAVGTAYVHFAVEHGAYFDVMFRSGLDRDDLDPNRDLTEDSFEILMATVADFLAENDIPGADPRIVAMYFWSLAHGLASLAVDDSLPTELSGLTMDEYVAGVFSMVTSILER